MLIPGKLYRLNKDRHIPGFLRGEKDFFNINRDGIFLFLKSELMENSYHGTSPNSKPVYLLYFLYEDRVGTIADHYQDIFEEISNDK
jgi:hypothetical protein